MAEESELKFTHLAKNINNNKVVIILLVLVASLYDNFATVVIGDGSIIDRLRLKQGYDENRVAEK